MLPKKSEFAFVLDLEGVIAWNPRLRRRRDQVEIRGLRGPEEKRLDCEN